jgi:NifU-like protein involved in Fe-S cluster formation
VDEAVIKYYRRLLKEDFPHAGALDNPSVFVEAIGHYMQLYLQVANHRIADIKYLCSCEPSANVAVEVLCTLVKGKTLDEAAGLKAEAFNQLLGSREEELQKKVGGLLELLNEGIARYHNTPTGAKGPVTKDGDGQGGKLNWDGALSI